MIAVEHRSEPDLSQAAASQSVPIPLAVLLAILLSVPAWAALGWLVISVA